MFFNSQSFSRNCFFIECITTTKGTTSKKYFAICKKTMSMTNVKLREEKDFVGNNTFKSIWLNASDYNHEWYELHYAY